MEQAIILARRIEALETSIQGNRDMQRQQRYSTHYRGFEHQIRTAQVELSKLHARLTLEMQKAA